LFGVPVLNWYRGTEAFKTVLYCDWMRPELAEASKPASEQQTEQESGDRCREKMAAAADKPGV